MFLLSQLTDNVRVNPQDFNKASAVAIKDALNRKYSNRILHQVGLGIRVFDIESISDPIVLACQDGSYQCKVVFRLAVFRPLKGEVLVGKIKDGSAQQGLKVSIDFFEDIIIPPNFLMPGTVFDAEEGVWVWKYEGNDLYMVIISIFKVKDPDQEIRFRVENDVFIDVGPIREPKNANSVEKIDESSSIWNKNVPYTIIASAAESGLGLLSWWE